MRPRTARTPVVGIAALILTLSTVSVAQTSSFPAHRIQVRTVKGVAEFYDRVTGKKFIPRGNNYVRLAVMKKKHEPTSMLYHSTFNSGRYERNRASAALKQMARDGYNVVRVFLNHATEGDISGEKGTLSKSYVDNFVDFLRLAKANKLYVIPTIDWVPVTNVPAKIPPQWCPDFQCTNVHILTSIGVHANEEFFARFVKELGTRKAPTDWIMAYELRNELTFESDLPPLSLTSGTLTAANGKTYDLASAADKQMMLEEGLVYWIDHVRAAIRTVDPTSLVTVGLIPPQGPYPMRQGETKLSVTRFAIQRSTADFIDVHIYPMIDNLGMKEFAENFGFGGVHSKPVIIGEFGGLFDTYPSPGAAAHALVEWQYASCAYGIDGWLLWSWDIDVERDCWTAADSGGVINRALAPVRRPNPCGPPDSLAVKRSAQARRGISVSKTEPGSDAQFLVDGTMKPWNSGDLPPQWVEVDLQAPTTLRGIRLVVSQSPPGPTTHQIWAKSPGGEYKMVREFRGQTKDKQVLVHMGTGLSNIRWVKVVTTESPSWVGWREIEVLRVSD